jgi:hypothetical protein
MHDTDYRTVTHIRIDSAVFTLSGRTVE